MNRYLFYIIAILSALLLITVKSCRIIQEDRDRLSDNQRTLLSDVEVWRTKAGHSAATVERLTLSASELRGSNIGLEAKIKELDIKLRRVQSTSTTSVRTEFIATAPVHDTIVMWRDKPTPAKTFTWSDPWARVEGIIAIDSVVCKVQTTDTLTQVVHRVPRKFLFLRWGTKAIEQTVTTANPHNRITYTRYIELKK